MNPIGFFGTALGLDVSVEAIVEHFHPDADLDSLRAFSETYLWIGDLLASQLPLASSLLFALVVHWRLRKFSRAPFRASFGALLFVDGVANCAHAIAHATCFRLSSDHLDAVMSAIRAVAIVYSVLALVGVHRLRRWTQALLPLFFGFVAVVLATFVVGLPLLGAMQRLAAQTGKATLKLGNLRINMKSETSTTSSPANDAGPAH